MHYIVPMGLFYRSSLYWLVMRSVILKENFKDFFKDFFYVNYFWSLYWFFFYFAILFLFYLVFWQRGIWDPSSLTRDWTHTTWIGRWSLNHRTTMEVPWRETLNSCAMHSSGTNLWYLCGNSQAWACVLVLLPCAKESSWKNPWIKEIITVYSVQRLKVCNPSPEYH